MELEQAQAETITNERHEHDTTQDITKEDSGIGNNNLVFLSGRISSEPVFSHEVFGEGFYEMNMNIDRLSGAADIIPITMSERLLGDAKIYIGKQVCVKGQFRSYNKLIGDRSKLMLTVFAREIEEADSQVLNPNPNIIELVGYICKPPIYRTTPFNREICDVLVAVNRAYNKSDYIPAIAWGRNARFTKNMLVGEKVHISGRIQSREYQKRLDDGTIETRTAFEVSINRVSRDAIESQFSDSDISFLTEE